MDLKSYKMGWCGLDWYGSGWGPVEGSCEYGIEPLVSIKCREVLSGCTVGGSSRRAQLCK
jgi:hypothetical protein